MNESKKDIRNTSETVNDAVDNAAKKNTKSEKKEEKKTMTKEEKKAINTAKKNAVNTLYEFIKNAETKRNETIQKNEEIALNTAFTAVQKKAIYNVMHKAAAAYDSIIDGAYLSAYNAVNNAVNITDIESAAAAFNAAEIAANNAVKAVYDAAAVSSLTHHEKVLDNVIRAAAACGIEYYVNEKKNKLYLFKFKSTDGKKNAMIFKIRYSEKKQINMLIKSRYVFDESIIFDKSFSESKDNECNYFRYIENDNAAQITRFINAFMPKKNDSDNAANNGDTAANNAAANNKAAAQ